MDLIASAPMEAPVTKNHACTVVSITILRYDSNPGSILTNAHSNPGIDAVDATISPTAAFTYAPSSATTAKAITLILHPMLPPLPRRLANHDAKGNGLTIKFSKTSARSVSE